MAALPIDSWTFTRQQIEAELLLQVRRAEAEFRDATSDEKEAASERYRDALQRFSDLILDRRVPPGLSIQQ